MADKPDKPVDWYPDSPWPLAAALACVAVGVSFAVLGHWRRAAVMIAGGVFWLSAGAVIGCHRLRALWAFRKLASFIGRLLQWGAGRPRGG